MVKRTRQSKQRSRKTFKRKSKRFFRMKGGELLDCAKEGFDYDMRKAGLGAGYNVYTGEIHDDGEEWDYEKLQHFTMNGIVGWWINHLKSTGVTFTDDEIKRIKENDILAILGAFFHRYKIVAERFSQLRRVLNKGVVEILIKQKNYTGLNSFKKYGNSEDEKTKPAKANMKKIGSFVETFGLAADLPIESAIDKAQCIMFYIIKHKGAVPSGFEMDKRIEERAKTPIKINGDWKKNQLTQFGGVKLEAVVKWTDFFEKANKELSSPPVTFGVFE